jgi:hypothetical protein
MFGGFFPGKTRFGRVAFHSGTPGLGSGRERRPRHPR